jgi:hypothetical protein
MKSLTIHFAAVFTFISINLFAQFPYTLQLNPVSIPGLNGLHSYAYAQSNGKWLIVGGRLDGLHARQPFNSFPSNQNNAHLYVIDPINKQFWKRPLNNLPVAIKEQLQSTNMNSHP